MTAKKTHIIHVRTGPALPLAADRPIIIRPSADAYPIYNVASAHRGFYQCCRTPEATECRSTVLGEEHSRDRIQTYDNGIILELYCLGQFIPTLREIQDIVIINSLRNGLGIICFPVTFHSQVQNIFPFGHIRKSRYIIYNTE